MVKSGLVSGVMVGPVELIAGVNASISAIECTYEGNMGRPASCIVAESELISLVLLSGVTVAVTGNVFVLEFSYKVSFATKSKLVSVILELVLVEVVVSVTGFVIALS